jgi:hypothetical protein
MRLFQSLGNLFRRRPEENGHFYDGAYDDQLPPQGGGNERQLFTALGSRTPSAKLCPYV